MSTSLTTPQQPRSDPKAKDRDRDEDGENDAAPSGGASRPPTKRARKAINCTPCRTSKLKCDKARPCSSCVLRGTASQCYTDSKDETSYRRNGIDPHNEIARMRQSLATLEAYVVRGPSSRPAELSSASSSKDRNTLPKRDNLGGVLKQEADADAMAVPGMLAERGKGGFYAGPTSAATLLYSLKTANDARDGNEDAERASASGSNADSDVDDVPTDISRGFDDDLLAQLPAIHVIDGLVDYYLNFCNWMYRHVYPPTFTASWNRFKDCASADRLMLATLAAVMAVAVRYLSEQHALLSALSTGTREEIGERFYMVACEALARYRAESRVLSLELVELLLIRTHYLTLSKTDSEEIWTIRGELVSIGTAMGLHRDPDKWRMSREVAERRRWAWWHILLLERWQCFLFGRPLSIASHHFDTRMPSHVDTKIDKTGRLFLPNLVMFKLADILGDIVDDAVSIRPVPYSRVLERDKELVAWMEDLPRELDLDEYRLARSLASPDPADMRLGVLSVIIRTSYYHIRFTLHRPYAAAAHDHPSQQPSTSGSASQEHHARMAQSLDTAAVAADKLIQLVAQARPEVLGSGNNASLAVAAHVHWGPFHCFSAAMFFSLQLVADPQQPGASLFRANIRRVLDLLSMSRGVPIADKASDMLRALRPLYDSNAEDEFGGKGRSKENVIALVKSLAFPYHDSFASHGHGTRSQHTDSPRSAGAMSPTTVRMNPVGASSASSPGGTLIPMVSPSVPRPPGHSGLTPAPPYSRSASQAQLSDILAPAPGGNATATKPTGLDYAPYGPQNGQSTTSGVLRPTPTFPLPASGGGAFNANPSGADNASMWGASVGFGQGEWSRFLDVLERTEPTGLMNA
ncbi:uncharacterized protein FOMMEDRAFT_113458 [Fomitiporia mediterranea MF3/22]|uniref:uncharacterized protein n=1 Tax=Fomitiporia mediterranea (strain MF3/22) TaxID=694068 RepID=UPI0004407E6F|nr:uncharacterized protein FOMMEDRAFT_113458 [Fomitiporia mediterranea MF3/22]EJC98892.1 hypothetical protein FOMMEDRAFT_113458 [Fomitiporia mediterranea MF3/22]